MFIRPVIGAIVLVSAAARVTKARAQLPASAMQVGVGFGVDTARSPNREILAL